MNKLKLLILILAFGSPYILPGQEAARLVKGISAGDTMVFNRNMRLLKTYLSRQIKKGNHDSVMDISSRVLKVARDKKINFEYTYIYNRIGFSFEKINRYDSALTYFKRVLDSGYTSKKYNEYISALNHTGIYYYSNGNYNKALDYFLNYLKTSEEVRDSVQILGGLVNIGNVYIDIKKPRIALTYFKKAFHYFDTLQKCKAAARELSLGNAYSDIGYYEKKASYTDSAYFWYTDALQKSKDCKNNQVYSILLSNISNIYYAREDYKRSIELLLETIRIKTEQGYPRLLTDYTNLGGSYLKTKEYSKAKEAFSKIFESDQIIGLDNYATAYNGLAISCRELGDYKKSAEYMELYALYKDSLYLESSSEKRKELELNFEFEKKQALTRMENDKQRAVAMSEAKKQKFITWSVCAVLALMTLFAYFVLRGYRQKQKANILISQQKQEVERQKELVEEKQKEIIDSINYAKRIQNTLLAKAEYIDRNINENFILFKPKDIVSGDFYWAADVLTETGEELFFLACCDSTGHGVPGAFMSLLNIGFLSEAIKEKGIVEPNKVFDYVRERLINSVSQEDQKDGFDGVLICFNKTTGQITYSAANNSPVLVTDDRLLTLKADKMPVGKGERMAPFTLYTIERGTGQVLYLFTDGFPDQFGGPKGKKFKYKQLEELLLAGTMLSLKDQSLRIESTFNSWRGKLEQVDDVLVMGIKI